MKDIPVFNTSHGVASLILREIPYRRKAHIKLQSTLEPEALLAECIEFCRACGAEWIEATGHTCLEKYPLTTAIVEMTCPRERIGQTDARLVSVTEQTWEHWLALYRQRMEGVPNAAYLDSRDAREFLEKGDCYFVYRADALLGLGKAAKDRIDLVISVIPGMGETVLRALCAPLTEEILRVVVAGANTRAVRLYQRLGFTQEREISRWYRVF